MEGKKVVYVFIGSDKSEVYTTLAALCHVKGLKASSIRNYFSRTGKDRYACKGLLVDRCNVVVSKNKRRLHRGRFAANDY